MPASRSQRLARRSPAKGPFIVVGMGRSGTSYVGAILHAEGIGMGDALKPPDEHNQSGYFEDLEATQMHAQWLAQRGLTFASVSGDFPLETTPDETQAIRSYITRRERSARRWGLKAPGILFFWEAWRKLLPERSIVLVPVRHPSAVSNSFERYGLDRGTALALWLQLNRLALHAATAGPFRSAFLDFDDRSRFARALRSAIGPYVDPYQPELRHARPHSELLSPEFRELYNELLARASRPI